ncbi:TlpA family protein disulfide reductase [Belliella sp. DSM 107340]|uniref:TlpA family protein disulfide reductase n=1 Tax=Belliella calami TaxID=2923436 RepID=A0ABS9UTB4_9BACT|nr:TlpA disulfide reductase family protein [Belliella calami]MCH7399866.1 TlpA family protein disulfide reductase [Belliella calami]
MKTRVLLASFSIFLLAACSQSQNSKHELQGMWHAELDINPDVIPVELELEKSGEKWEAYLINGEEKLKLDEVLVKNDSIFIPMGIFDSEIKASIKNDSLLQGVFVKNTSSDYGIPFEAKKGAFERFEVTEKPKTDFSGKWKTIFQDTNGKTYEAIGEFVQNGIQIRGTFLTALGDYRFLAGNVSGETFFLSAFDGSHAFFFTADLLEDGSIQGRFRSGPRYQETFIAVRDEDFELPDAYELTYLKDGYEELDFSFPDTEGNMVSIKDDKFKNKVVLVQLFGTWCPNCMDETKFLAPWYEKNKDRGIEIIGLAFESKPDFDYASQRVKKSAEKLGAGYTFLIAGVSNKEKAAEALPALSSVVAFPTLIYIGKNGKVRHIHTGFNGPGTGGLYDRWIEEHEELVSGLLREE